jgi:hypothetical protein
MTEVPEPGNPAGTSAPVTTGIASIDTVLDLVAGLDGRPLAEHAPVFEAAHAELRRTLDDPPPA